MHAQTSDLPLHVVEAEDRIIVGFPTNTTLSGENAEEFSRELAAIVDSADHPHLVVDLGGVSVVTSMALAKFLSLNGRVRNAGGRLTLSNLNPTVRQVFKLTRLDLILEITQRAP